MDFQNFPNQKQYNEDWKSTIPDTTVSSVSFCHYL